LAKKYGCNLSAFGRQVGNPLFFMGIIMEDENKSREELLAEMQGLREQLDSITQQLNGAASEKAADQFKDLVQLAPIAMALSDSNGNVEYLNSKFSETFGYIHEDIPTLEAWRTLAYPDEAYRCRVVAAWNQALAKATKEGGPVPAMPYKAACKNGEVRTVEISGALIAGKCLVIFNDITERKKMEEERTELIDELREALEKIKTLRGILPICASCKKIRNDEGYWQQIEVYIRNHSAAEFSHGICPECINKLYPYFQDNL
jgi:PAS domain S-box-containing protein